MIFYQENPKYSTKKNLLELVSLARLKDTTSIHKKSIAFLYTNSEKMGTVLIIVSNKMKYLGIKLIKH